MTKTVGLEMAQKGNITCNAICPGYVLTDLIKNQLKDTAKARGIPEVRPAHRVLVNNICGQLVLTFHYLQLRLQT